MSFSLYVLGPPGVGKSTLLAGLMSNASPATPGRKIHGLLYGHYFQDETCLYLGKMRDKFPGTDGLPMNVGPDAINWLTSGQLPDIILGEGARLGYAGFLNELSRRTETYIVHLTASEQYLEDRCRARGSNQKAAWRKGAATRALTAASKTQNAKIITIRTDGLSTTNVLRLVRAELPKGLLERLG